LHAVSVGEIQTAAPLVREWRKIQPKTSIFVSVTTLAGRSLAEQKLGGLADSILYLPFDYCFAVRRVLRRLRPSLLVIMETEIWPNLFREAARSGVRLMIVNGRISDRALRRYQRLRWFFRHVLDHATRILVQDELAMRRYVEIGADPARVSIGGNLKYDFDPSNTSVKPDLVRWLNRLPPHRTWIAASTMPPAAPDDPDEDDLVVQAFEELAVTHPDLLLILAPRRPERFGAASERLLKAGVPSVARSRLDELTLPGVLLLDSIGELAAVFRHADVVFMGGSIVDRGGHNPLEPAAFGVPVVAGPHMENFAEMTEGLEAAKGICRIGAADELHRAVARLLREPGQTGANAAAFARSKRGATALLLREMLEQFEAAAPGEVRCPYAVLKHAWLAGLAAHRAMVKARRLSRPVISVGNLSMGGSGKTPLVLWLAERLEKPVILMRGYGRNGSRPLRLAPGAMTSVESSGDEAQLYLRQKRAAVGIGAARWENGRVFEAQGQAGVFLLDDGFQHWALERNLDIVLLDANDPLEGGVFPVGRLREPIEALSRAGAIVLTRAEPGRTYVGVLERIRSVNPTAPIFRARLRTCLPERLPDGPLAAFCGIGRPLAFRRSLDDLGIKPARFRAFRDHHVFREPELRSLSEGMSCVLTTEKDLVRIPLELVSKYRIQAVQAVLELDDAGGFLTYVRRATNEETIAQPDRPISSS